MPAQDYCVGLRYNKNRQIFLENMSDTIAYCAGIPLISLIDTKKKINNKRKKKKKTKKKQKQKRKKHKKRMKSISFWYLTMKKKKKK